MGTAADRLHWSTPRTACNERKLLRVQQPDRCRSTTGADRARGLRALGTPCLWHGEGWQSCLMTPPAWLDALNLELAHQNVRREYHGDWHKDPWGWPEYEFLLKNARPTVLGWFSSTGCAEVALIRVPKENWGVRPAVVLDLLDRLGYQAIVDLNSAKLIGDMSPSAYGWRLIPGRPEAGKYASDRIQWDEYRTHIESAGGVYDAALRTDVVSCFASMQPDMVLDDVSSRAGGNASLDRLGSFLLGFDQLASRTGLPQRARPSSVLANMMMRHFDDVLEAHAEVIPELMMIGSTQPAPRLSFVRWMDDMWLFGDDAAAMRRAQLELQETAMRFGLNLNSSKTEVLEGPDVHAQALEVELSAVDDGLLHQDSKALEELIEQVLESPDTAGRTRVKFMISRMLDHNVHYREQELVLAAPRMPHCADSLARYMRSRFRQESLSEWFLSEIHDAWDLLQWPHSHYLGMFPTDGSPPAGLRDYAAEKVSDLNTELPLLTVAAQRLAAWDPGYARTTIAGTVDHRSNPHERRILSLAALSAKETRMTTKRWLNQHAANAVTLRMLEDVNFRTPRVDASYAVAGPAA